MKEERTLVLVASEGEARFLTGEGKGKGLAEIRTLDVEDYPDADQEFTDRRGRWHGGDGSPRATAEGGVARQGFSSKESVQDARRTVFAGVILEALGAEWEKGKHDRILLAASPKLLGELRSRMPDKLKQAVFADMPKDLVKIAPRDLPSHFEGVAEF